MYFHCQIYLRKIWNRGERQPINGIARFRKHGMAEENSYSCYAMSWYSDPNQSLPIP